MTTYSNWKIILTQYLNKVGGMQFLLKCTFDIKLLNCHVPTNFADIFNVWSEISEFKSDTVQGICKQIIWNNKLISINNKYVYYRSFHEAGIVCRVCNNVD